MSSTEAEYIVAAEASMEAVWMRKFINGLGGVVSSNKTPMEMLCDNEPTIAIANDLEILKGARHFQRKYHYIREVIQEREIVLKKFHAYDNVADPFTKPMSYDKHYEHAMAIGIVPARSLIAVEASKWEIVRLWRLMEPEKTLAKPLLGFYRSATEGRLCSWVCSSRALTSNTIMGLGPYGS
ncbi:hypothetical protein Tco_0951342 [Tanacetum coccineum]|uniref:Uncharacterized protein n=1 Tax=Tanacetum coccineum TaxID=301880 RepID=A0ABQ5DTW6_9ASTR